MSDTVTSNHIQSDVAQLESGWLDSTPDGDNIVTDMARAQADAYHALAVASGHPTMVDPQLGLSMSDSRSASPFGNVAVLGRPLTADGTRSAAAAMHEFYGASTGGPFIVFSAWPMLGADIDGLTLVGHPPLMVHRKPAADGVRPGIDVREVGSTDELTDFEQALIEGYPAAELLPWRAGCFLGPSALACGWRFFVGYDDGAPVATAASFATSTVNLIEMVAVKEATRGKGLGATVTAAASRTDLNLPAVLISSDLGRPVYARLGFDSIVRFNCWIGQR